VVALRSQCHRTPVVARGSSARRLFLIAGGVMRNCKRKRERKEEIEGKKFDLIGDKPGEVEGRGSR
jgi:hypothetical protein